MCSDSDSEGEARRSIIPPPAVPMVDPARVAATIVISTTNAADSISPQAQAHQAPARTSIEGESNTGDRSNAPVVAATTTAAKSVPLSRFVWSIENEMLLIKAGAEGTLLPQFSSFFMKRKVTTAPVAIFAAPPGSVSWLGR